MAITRKDHFLTKDKDWLVAQLDALADEKASGRSEQSVSSGDTSISFMRGWSIEKRDDELRYSLSLRDSETYPYTPRITRTSFGVRQEGYGY